MSASADISKAFDDSLVAIGLPTALENVKFKPAVDTAYLRSTLLPAGTDATGYDDASDEHLGIYQVDINAPTGKGSADARDIAGQIELNFKRGTRLTSGTTTILVQRVSTTKGYTDGAYFIIRVEVWYISFTEKL